MAGFSTFPDLMHWVQTRTLRTVPSITAVTF